MSRDLMQEGYFIQYSRLNVKTSRNIVSKNIVDYLISCLILSSSLTGPRGHPIHTERAKPEVEGEEK